MKSLCVAGYVHAHQERVEGRGEERGPDVCFHVDQGGRGGGACMHDLVPLTSCDREDCVSRVRGGGGDFGPGERKKVS